MLKKHEQFCYDNFEDYYLSQIVESRGEQSILNSGDLIQIALCDDEKIYLELLTEYIKKYLASYNEMAIRW